MRTYKSFRENKTNLRTLEVHRREEENEKNNFSDGKATHPAPAAMTAPRATGVDEEI